MSTVQDGPRREARDATRFRWWPAPAILLLSFLGWIAIWFIGTAQRQDKNLRTFALVAATVFLLLLWLLFFSRLCRKLRAGIAGGFLAGLLLFVSLVRIRGVTGDFIPVLEWRWSQSSRQLLPAKAAPRRHTNTTVALAGAAFPQFLGPNRDGTLPGPNLATNWQDVPPKLLWRHPVGAAWSGFAIVGNFAITQEQRGVDEMVTCYDLLSGEVIWSHADAAHYHTTIAGEGPRTTPTFSGGRLFTLGATGILNCLELQTGTVIWSKDILEDNGASVPDWGLSGSPLVFGGLVIVSAGGKQGRSLVAYDKSDGHFVWGGGNSGAGYSSPFAATFGGAPQIVIFNSAGVSAHSPENGDVLWHYGWRRGHPHVTMPLPLPQDRLLVSSGYGTGSELLQVAKKPDWTATRLWKSIRLKSKFANLIYRDGYIYGLDDGVLVCLDANSGELQWKEGRDGHGQLLLVRDLLLLMAENGDVVLLDPSPRGRRELSRFSALDGKTWNPPALAGPHLVIRNDREAACYLLPLAK